MSKVYKAEVTRSGDWWFINVPEVQGAYSQARRLDQVEALIREALALVLDVAEDSFDVELNVDPPAVVDEAIARIRNAEKELERATAELAAAKREAATIAVKKEGLTVRDAGRLIGVSFQRVGQLLHEGD